MNVLSFIEKWRNVNDFLNQNRKVLSLKTFSAQERHQNREMAKRATKIFGYNASMGFFLSLCNFNLRNLFAFAFIWGWCITIQVSQSVCLCMCEFVLSIFVFMCSSFFSYLLYSQNPEQTQRKFLFVFNVKAFRKIHHFISFQAFYFSHILCLFCASAFRSKWNFDLKFGTRKLVAGWSDERENR